MRAEAIHEEPDRVGAEHAADVIQRRHDVRLRQGEAGRVQRRRQPVDREIDVQQAHEECDPEAQRRDAAAVLEEIEHRGLAALGVVRDDRDVAVGAERPARSCATAASLRLGGRARRQRSESTRARNAPERRGERERQNAADDEHGAPPERLDELCGGDAGPDRTERDTAADEHHDQRAPLVRRVLRGEPDRVRQRGAQAETREEAQRRATAPSELTESVNSVPTPNATHEIDDDAAPADSIGERREQHRAEHDAEQPGAERRSESCRGRVPNPG